jgi:tetratricopeptide (TPR) repeat protein
MLSSKPTRWVAVVYAVLSVVLSRIPLFDYLGFEFSAATGVFAGFLGGLLTISLFRQQFDLHTTLQESEFFSFALRSIAVNTVLLLIPLVVISLNAFFVKNCSFTTGIGFYLLIPLLTVIFAVALSLGTAMWFRRSALMYTFLFFIFLLHPIYVTLTSPQVFAYNVFFGYFPGFTYDEVLGITPSLLFSRLATLIAGVTLFLPTMVVAARVSPSEGFGRKVAALRHLLQAKGESLGMVGGLLLLITAYVYRGELGFESSAEFIQKQLGSKYLTWHFNIYYSSEHVSPTRMKWIAAEHEFRFSQVSRALRMDFRGRIDSYLYPSPEVKERLLGTGTTNIAKPHRREIHVTLDTFESTFRHELVHVFAGAFGMPVLRISPSPALIEGLAVAVDWDAGDRTPHEIAAALLRSGRIQNVRAIFSFTGFAAKPSSVGYLLSGSFCRYLIEEYGLRRFISLYRYARFEGVYRRSLEDLIEEWREYLQSIETRPSETARTTLLLARPSILGKVCARVVAARNAQALRMLNENRLREAAEIYHASYRMSNSRDAALGYFASRFRLGEYDSLITELHRILEDSTTTFAFFPTKLTLGDCYWLTNKPDRAVSFYKELRQADIGEVYNEAAAIRLESYRLPETWGWMKRYLASAGEDSLRISILREAIEKGKDALIARYLLGRLYFRLRDYKGAFGELSKIGRQLGNPILNYQLERTIGLCLLHLKDFQKAKVHLWQSLNYTANDGDRNLIDDLIEQCDWLDDHHRLLE